MNLNSKKFGIEHGLDMYATSYVVMPAEAIYEKDKLAEFKKVIDRCHIYIIGFLPKVDFVGADLKDNDLVLSFEVCNRKEVLNIGPLPPDLTFGNDDGYYYILNSMGERFWWSGVEMMKLLHSRSSFINFEVKYIGQAYGKEGSRNALDRLIKHETLQKIAIRGIPEGKKLALLLLEVEPNTGLITVFNPKAQCKDSDSARIKSGIDKLFGTTEAEQTSLYEAALIRYFSPQYNTEFKNSFPSTNLKILQDCYEKDFSAVVAQICIDDLPFHLYSEAVPPKNNHIATHDLHKEQDRKVFFSL